MNRSLSLLVWDPLIRIFHGSVAVFFALAFYLQGDWLDLHSHAGYTLALLVLFRVVWGLIGPKYARFADFVCSPKRVVAHLQQLLAGHSVRTLGHDPLGGVMVLCLLVLIMVTAVSGMCLFAMEGSGPLAGTLVADWPGGLVETLHDVFAHATLVLVGVHVTGVLIVSVLRHENLLAAMLTGRKSGGGTK